MRYINKIMKLLCWLILSSLICISAAFVILFSLFLFYTSDPSLPTIDHISDYHPKVVTHVLDRDGQLIGELFEERRTVVPLDRIPRSVINAFVDAEDAQFYEHRGVDYMGIIRAVAQSIFQGTHLRGASTITQQLIKTYVLKSHERSLRRKVQELYLALRLERKIHNKDEILWLYLNQLYFGHQRYGIEEASRFYFGKSISDVSTGEAAVLASLPKAPEEISPRRNPERAKNRQRYVLSQLVRYHHISLDEAKRFANEPIRLVKEPVSNSSLAPEFVDEAERMLVERFSREKLPYLGLTVQTTCDFAIQRAAREALEYGLRRVDERNNYSGPVRHLTTTQASDYIQQLQRTFVKGPPMGRIVEGVVAKLVDGDGHFAHALVNLGAVQGWLPLPVAQDRYNNKRLLPSQRYKEGDVLRVRVASIGSEGPVLTLENGPQGAVVVIDPETRHVLAMVGGYGYRRSNFNRALRAKRQPGSTFKAFLYASAFASKRYTPATTLQDSPQVYDLPGQAPWAPSNANEHAIQFMGPVRLRQALALSLNTVASQLSYDLKPEPIIAMAHALGIESSLVPNYALALGASEVTLLELTNSYATFAAGGRYGAPLWNLRIGSELPKTSELSQRISPELAYMMSNVLESVIEEGTGSAFRGKLKHPAAGKTGSVEVPNKGTTDAWFIGYTPNLAAGVWVGIDNTYHMQKTDEGANTALPIWLDIMQIALQSRPAVPFTQPPGIVRRRIDPMTGKLVISGSSPSIDEIFMQGTEPYDIIIRPGEEAPSTFSIE